MRLLILLLVAATLYSCKQTTVSKPKASNHICRTTAHETCDGSCDCDGLGCPKIDTTAIQIFPTKNIVDGRQTFSVQIGDSLFMDYMYPEEIAQSLKTGVWQYNEDLKVE